MTSSPGVPALIPKIDFPSDVSFCYQGVYHYEWTKNSWKNIWACSCTPLSCDNPRSASFHLSSNIHIYWKIISSIINYFSIRISIFRSIVPPDSRRFRYISLFVSGFCAQLLCQGAVGLEFPFLVESETSNSAQVQRFTILKFSIFAWLPPFLWFHHLVHGQIEAG